MTKTELTKLIESVVKKQLNEAYISKQDVAKMRDKLKKEFPSKDGWKLSVTIQNYSTINVNIMQSPIDFGIKYEQLNNMYPEKYSPELSKVIKKINKIITPGSYNRNANDPTADYGDYTFYTHISIGKWNRPVVYV